MITTLRSAGVPELACRHDTLEADAHAAVLHCAAADRMLGVLSRRAKFKPKHVTLSRLEKPRLGLMPSLTTGA